MMAFKQIIDSLGHHLNYFSCLGISTLGSFGAAGRPFASKLSKDLLI